MSTKSLERVLPLIMVMLMITTAFIPAANAASAVSKTITVSSSDPEATDVKVRSYLAPPDWDLRSWQDVENAGAGNIPSVAERIAWNGSKSNPPPDEEVTGIRRVVTDTGKIKMYDPETRTIRIKDESTSASKGSDDELKIRLVNATPDLGTFTEIFEITAHGTVALDESEDFLATWALHNGEENVTRAEWFVWENRLHTVEIPIIEYRNVTLEMNTSEDVAYKNAAQEKLASENGPF